MSSPAFGKNPSHDPYPKQIEDAFLHPDGDAMLRQLAGENRESFRVLTDTVRNLDAHVASDPADHDASLRLERLRSALDPEPPTAPLNLPPQPPSFERKLNEQDVRNIQNLVLLLGDRVQFQAALLRRPNGREELIRTAIEDADDQVETLIAQIDQALATCPELSQYIEEQLESYRARFEDPTQSDRIGAATDAAQSARSKADAAHADARHRGLGEIAHTLDKATQKGIARRAGVGKERRDQLGVRGRLARRAEIQFGHEYGKLLEQITRGNIYHRAASTEVAARKAEQAAAQQQQDHLFGHDVYVAFQNVVAGLQNMDHAPDPEQIERFMDQIDLLLEGGTDAIRGTYRDRAEEYAIHAHLNTLLEAVERIDQELQTTDPRRRVYNELLFGRAYALQAYNLVRYMSDQQRISRAGATAFTPGDFEGRRPLRYVTVFRGIQLGNGRDWGTILHPDGTAGYVNPHTGEQQRYYPSGMPFQEADDAPDISAFKDLLTLQSNPRTIRNIVPDQHAERNAIRAFANWRVNQSVGTATAGTLNTSARRRAVELAAAEALNTSARHYAVEIVARQAVDERIANMQPTIQRAQEQHRQAQQRFTQAAQELAAAQASSTPVDPNELTRLNNAHQVAIQDVDITRDRLADQTARLQAERDQFGQHNAMANTAMYHHLLVGVGTPGARGWLQEDGSIYIEGLVINNVRGNWRLYPNGSAIHYDSSGMPVYYRPSGEEYR